jgi:hypothetical protein
MAGCSSCEILVINGVPCHETGCPDAWKDEERECRWCGGKFKPEEKNQLDCSEDCYHSFIGDDWNSGDDE